MSVKVAVRVRPFNERELAQNPRCCIEMNGPQTIITDPSGPTANNKEGKKTFTFDFSFWSHDGYEVNDEGVSVPSGNDSKYAD